MVVLVDGRLVSSSVPSGLAATSLAALPTAERETLIARWLATLATTGDVTECWSFADPGDGVVIATRPGGEPGKPGQIQVLSLSTGAIHGGRIVIDLADGSALDLVILHLDLAPSRASVGLDVTVGAGARLNVDELQFCGFLASGGAIGQLFSHVHLTVGHDAEVKWTTCAQGGELVRFRTVADLAAPGASLTLNGLAMLDGKRQAHWLTRLVHTRGDTTSRQVFKTIADGHSIGSFDGLVTVAEGADGADAEQRNYNLLLSPTARVDSRPQLDILADEVKASHGATVSRPNPEELFYLRTRGLDAGQALAMLMRGFADDILLRLHHPAARFLASQNITGR
jgi:Fe-S cluster assembly protein SufD